MQIIIVMFIAVFGWILAFVAFEAGWKALRGKGTLGFSKGNICKVWWGTLGFLSIMSNPVIFLFNLPVILVVGLSHIELACRKDEIITISEMAKNIPGTVRELWLRIQLYIK